ncbi:divergent polysaccharide deacetylase family protein [Helicobacter sp. MIT 14-3879]|uniref:divergent polysaccharide deacetylase family protein n=1 Tax=Helicobacter sp. MIT 14-3879 TaxID=2040649 RepID=UPI0015F15E76|nr:divergent polysaccharide deacetylase family protein [Helicobacter sp. MIT 14-3879]
MVVNDKAITFDKEIQSLEEANKNIDEYTKQYKRRIDYNKPISSESNDYQDSILTEQNKNEENKSRSNRKPSYNKILKTPKPKLVIIIDDIANKKQLNDILNIKLKLTPSIFPIAKNDSAMIEAVSKLDFFMVHLPLEAHKYTDDLDTIKTNDSIERIKAKIEDIKQIMPKTKYINNHTGSKFTENKTSTETLLSILDSYLIEFVDSKTTPNSVLNDIAKEQNKLILYRDVFIDNKLDSTSLNKQIKEGVNIAKSRGYAILIAHPHKESLEAIKIAKNHILKDVDVIYLDELDSILKNKKVTQYAQRILNERKHKNNQ